MQPNVSSQSILLVKVLLSIAGVFGDVENLKSVLCLKNHALYFSGECIRCSYNHLNEDVAARVSTRSTSQLNKINVKRKAKIKSNSSSMEQLIPHELSVIEYETTIHCLQNVNDLPDYIHQKEVSRLQGNTVKVVTIVRYPFVKVMNNNYTGVIYELLYAMQKKYNFSLAVTLPYDGNWGAPLENGTWNGMIGMVIRKEADLGAAGFTVTLDRFKVIDFTWAFHQETSAILIPPPTEGEKLTVLIRPLSKQVWAAVLATFFVLIPSLYLFHRGSLSIQRQSKNGDQSGLALCSELLWFLIGSILQQGLISPVDKSTRFLIVIWWFTTLVIANIYVAFLVSYLSAPQLHNVVDSLEELSHQSKIKWTFRTNTAHRSLFKSATSVGVYKAIGDRAPDSDLVLDDDTGVSQVLKNKFAFIKEKSFLDVAIGKDFEAVKKCRMTLAKQTFFSVGTALVVRKKNPLLYVLDYDISISIASGLMEKWKQIHWPKSLACEDAATYIISTRPKTRKLTFDDVQGAYFILGCGVALSIISFLVERLLLWIRHLSYYLIINWKLATTWRFVR